MIKIKRTYDEPVEADGFRILVDRLWSRGLARDRAKVDLWLREVAPSDVLRKSFAHDPEKWNDFQESYKKELRDKPELIDRIKRLEAEKGVVTLLFAAKDREHNNAVVLRSVLQD